MILKFTNFRIYHLTTYHYIAILQFHIFHIFQCFQFQNSNDDTLGKKLPTWWYKKGFMILQFTKFKILSFYNFPFCNFTILMMTSSREEAANVVVQKRIYNALAKDVEAQRARFRVYWSSIFRGLILAIH